MNTRSSSRFRDRGTQLPRKSATAGGAAAASGGATPLPVGPDRVDDGVDDGGDDAGHESAVPAAPGSMLDRTDRRILAYLQTHGRATNLELAAAARLSPAQCQRRHRRLEERGYIVNYETRLAAQRLGWTVFAFIHVAMERGHIRDIQRFKDLVREMPEVQECYSVTGDFDYVIKVVAHDLKSLSTLLMDRLMRLPGVSSVRSSICLDEIKCGLTLPLDPTGREG